MTQQIDHAASFGSAQLQALSYIRRHAERPHAPRSIVCLTLLLEQMVATPEHAVFRIDGSPLEREVRRMFEHSTPLGEQVVAVWDERASALSIVSAKGGHTWSLREGDPLPAA